MKPNYGKVKIEDVLHFKWGWCDQCGAHIKCPVCGNNCCSAMYGCKYCELAYQYQELAYKTNMVPTKRQILKLGKK